MHFLALLSLTCLTLTTLAAPAPSTGQVFSIKAKHVQIPKQFADKIRKERSEGDFVLDNLVQKQEEAERQIMKLNDDAGVVGQAMFNLTDWNQYVMIGNITIGTPGGI